VGWYGFNAGSALAADGIAANAFTTTTLAAAVAGFVWAMAEYVVKGKPSILGFCSGIVAGLVVVTPACGFVLPSGAVVIGIAAGLVPFFACYRLKRWLGYDDALDTFGVHAVGGTLGALLTGILASAEANPALETLAGTVLWWEQVKAILVTLLLAVVATAVLAYLVRAVVGLRVDEEVETIGLDLSEHGEEGYHGA
jgi:ammonium transporter, Amt family